MNKHISFLLIFSLVISMFMPMTVVNAQGTDPNIILYETIRDSIIGQSLQNTDVDSLILVDSIRTLQGTGFLSGLIDDITDVLNSNENNIAFKNFLKDNYVIDKANVDKFINILRDWSDVNSNDEDIFLKLFTKLKRGEDLDPVNDKDVLDYIAALRETVTTEMSNVIIKWNNEVLLDSNRKTEFALEVIGKVLSNIKAEKDSQGNLVFSLTSDISKLDEDLINIENEFLNDVVPRLSTQSFSYVDAINECIPVLNEAVQEVVDTTSLSVDDMVNLIQALGINYTSYSEPSGGTTKPKDSSSDDTDESEETLVEVNVPEDPQEPVTGIIGEESTTVEVKDGMTKVSVKEETILSTIEDIVNAVKESEDERKAQLVLEIADTEDLNLSVSVPSEAITKLLENNVDLIIKSDDIEYNIPADTLDSQDIPKDAVVEIKSKELSEDEVKAIKETAENEGNIAKVLDFSLEINTEKEVKSLTKFNNYIVIKINVEGLGNKDKLGMYYLNEETNELEFVGGKVKEGKLIMKTNHFSKYAIIESNKQFIDTVKHWSKYYVESMAAKHVVDGYPDGTFMPEKKITRAEFAKIVVKALELELVKYTDGFSDVTSDAWYADYIATAKAAGLVEGYEDGTFRPNQEITRLEMAALLSRAVKDVELTEDDTEAILKAYADSDEIQEWGRGYAAKAIKAELMIGVTHDTFVPNGKTIRAEAATAIYRLYNR